MSFFDFGFKKPKKQRKREVLEENIRKGRAAEEQYKLNAMMRGMEVERTGKGSDYIERKRDLLTGRVVSSRKVEVKSSRTAPLSKLQKKTRKRGSSYKVVREEPLFY